MPFDAVCCGPMVTGVNNPRDDKAPRASEEDAGRRPCGYGPGVAGEYLTPENSTPAERAAARRQLIADEVARERAERGNRAANRLERELFAQWEWALRQEP